jgi:YesN/AraC family two-component response regulator
MADLVFLDMQMPEMDGFQVISEVSANEMPVTIFVTAHGRFALRAFNTNAIDYLLKPFGKERFERALGRAKQRLAGKLDHDEVRRIISSLEQLAAERKHPDRLAIPKNGRILSLREGSSERYGEFSRRERVHLWRSSRTGEWHCDSPSNLRYGWQILKLQPAIPATITTVRSAVQY